MSLIQKEIGTRKSVSRFSLLIWDSWQIYWISQLSCWLFAIKLKLSYSGVSNYLHYQHHLPKCHIYVPYYSRALWNSATCNSKLVFMTILSVVQYRTRRWVQWQSVKHIYSSSRNIYLFLVAHWTNWLLSRTKQSGIK